LITSKGFTLLLVKKSKTIQVCFQKMSFSTYIGRNHSSNYRFDNQKIYLVKKNQNILSVFSKNELFTYIGQNHSSNYRFDNQRIYLVFGQKVANQ
jgi:hypothetical protein